MTKHNRSVAALWLRLLGTLLAVLLPATIATAQQQWLYVESEGGWMDLDTGLVWLDYSNKRKGEDPTHYAFYQFDVAQRIAADLVHLGKDDWRVPTKAEMLTAFQHNIAACVPLYDTRPGYRWWSSDSKTKISAWAVDLVDGTSVVRSKESLLALVCVRKAGTIPGIVVSASSGLMTSEAGGTARFSVALNSPPSGEVTIHVESNAPWEGIPDRETLTFTPENWDVPQVVTVTGVDDEFLDGDIVYKIDLFASGGGYDDVWRPVAVVNLDDEAYTYASRDVPKNFSKVRETDSTLTVSDSYPIQGLAISISVTAEPQSMTLIAPDGSSQPVWAPYTLTTAFTGKDVQGRWTLRIRNDFGVSGKLTGWSIRVW